MRCFVQFYPRFFFRWDFKEYPVSNFAHTVLSRVSMDPLFVVEKLNPDLIQKIPKLRKALELRKQATEIAKYLVSCRIAAQNIKEENYKECIIKVNIRNLHCIKRPTHNNIFNSIKVT